MMLQVGVLLHNWIWWGEMYLYIGEEPGSVQAPAYGNTDLLLWKVQSENITTEQFPLWNAE